MTEVKLLLHGDTFRTDGRTHARTTTCKKKISIMMLAILSVSVWLQSRLIFVSMQTILTAAIAALRLCFALEKVCTGGQTDVNYDPQMLGQLTLKEQIRYGLL